MKILFINSCIYSGHKSRTLELARTFLDTLGENEISELALDNSILPLDERRLELRNRLVQNFEYGDEIFSKARQLCECDMVVVACPYWDMSFPAVLKSWVENIMVSGLTFELTEKGYNGLCKAKSVVYITTAGGYIGENNFGYDYIKACMNMVGIKKSFLLTAEGLDIWENDTEKILCEAKEKAVGLAKDF